MASVEKARAIIINKQDDFDVIRAILALTTYLKKHNAYKNEKMPSIVSLMHNHENISAAAIASGVYHEKSELIPQEELQYELKIRNLFFEDILAHIFAQVCRQPGLSWVVSELFDYAASEIYIENVANGGQDATELLTGKTFAEISRGVVNSIAIGIQRGTESFINPSSDMIFEKTDKLIHVAEDDNCLMIDFNRNVQLVGKEAKEQKKVIAPYHFLVLGWSSPLPDVIENISKYTRSGSTLTVISDHLALDEVEFTKYDNLDVKDTVKINPYEWNKVEKYFEEYKIWDKDNSQRPTNIIIMCQDDIDKVEADEKVAVLLLNIREFLKRKELDRVVNITTEMNLPEDQRLLSHTNAHDFIVGSEIANRMLVQVANDPDIYKVFTEILDAKGSELYMRNFAEYVDTDEPFNFNYVQEVVRQRANRGDGKQEIAIGWLRLGDSKRQTKACINPRPHIKNNIFRLEEGESFADYRLVVIAMDE